MDRVNGCGSGRMQNEGEDRTHTELLDDRCINSHGSEAAVCVESLSREDGRNADQLVLVGRAYEPTPLGL